MEQMAYIRGLGIPLVCVFAILAVFAISTLWKDRKAKQSEVNRG